MAEPVKVWRGAYRDPENLFGPLPGLQVGDTVAYEFELPERFEPWPGRSRVERTFVLLDVGVSFADPCWRRTTNTDGSVVETDPSGRDCWYVDLVSVHRRGADGYIFLDLYLDVIVPIDGRPYRLLDLDEYAEAMLGGTLSLAEAAEGLQRWQLFLDRYLHSGRWPSGGWSDFPPASVHELAKLDAPFATPPVRWNG